jgi:hypothetical protein
MNPYTSAFLWFGTWHVRGLEPAPDTDWAEWFEGWGGYGPLIPRSAASYGRRSSLIRAAEHHLSPTS